MGVEISPEPYVRDYTIEPTYDGEAGEPLMLDESEVGPDALTI